MSSFRATASQLAVIRICRARHGYSWDETSAIFNAVFFLLQPPTRDELYQQYTTREVAAAREAARDEGRYMSMIQRAAHALRSRPQPAPAQQARPQPTPAQQALTLPYQPPDIQRTHRLSTSPFAQDLLDFSQDNQLLGSARNGNPYTDTPASDAEQENGYAGYTSSSGPTSSTFFGHDAASAFTAAPSSTPSTFRSELTPNSLANQALPLMPFASRPTGISSVTRPASNSPTSNQAYLPYTARNGGNPFAHQQAFVNPFYGVGTASQAATSGAHSRDIAWSYATFGVGANEYSASGLGLGESVPGDSDLGEASSSISGWKRKRVGRSAFALDGAADDDDEAASDGNAKPMLMVHAGHFLVGWHEGEPSVDSEIPLDPSTIDGHGVFLKLDDPVYKLGGKVFRAAFSWIDNNGNNNTEARDVMLCRHSSCNVCDNRVAVMSSSTAQGTASPFVHHTCVQFGASHGSHAFNVFQPKQGLQTDYARIYPESQNERVGFNDGELRDVLVCIPETCAFCSSTREGKKPAKPAMLESEKKMDAWNEYSGRYLKGHSDKEVDKGKATKARRGRCSAK